MNIGTLLQYLGGAILLAFFCSLGLIARIRERRISERKLAQRRPSRVEEPSRAVDPESGGVPDRPEDATETILGAAASRPAPGFVEGVEGTNPTTRGSTR